MLRPTSLPHARALQAALRATRPATRRAAALATALLVLSTGLLTSAPALASTDTSASSPTSAASAAGAREAGPEQPLVPRIRSISPDFVPAKGPVVIRGTVTNTSNRTWTAINVHGFMGTTPITTSAELAAAAQEPDDADVGHRITVPGTFASIPKLSPGASAPFKVRLPQATLPVSSPGVYWFGVHVLGDNGQGGPRVAVGRDRTFLSYVPHSSLKGGAQQDAALVVPVRSGVVRGPDGMVIDPDTWGRSLRNGPLHDAVATGQAALGRPLTWLLDPAVPDVVRRLAHGNPPRTLGAPTPEDQASQSPSPSTDSAAAGATGSTAGTAAATVPTAATRHTAKRWLRQLHALLAADPGGVLGLPYGDLAVESAATYDRTLLRSAFQRSALSLRKWGVSDAPTVAPPDGRTTGETVRALPRGTGVLLADSGVSDTDHAVNRVLGHQVMLESTGAADGGPGPIDPRSPLALRQRILAEAAVRLLGDRQPLVVELPERLESRIRPSFFSGLDVPWLRLTTVDSLAAGPSTPLDPTRLRPPAPDEPQLSPRFYTTAQELLERGRTLQAVLTDNHALHRRLLEEVTGNASYAAARDPLVAFARLRVTDQWIRTNLNDIDLAAPPSVTLASTSGRFSVLVSNDLDVPVKVKVRALSDQNLQITGGETVPLPAHGRTSVLLNASTHQRGVHTVTLELTSVNGRLLGASDPLTMRAEQVSGLIWVIIGTGVALLFAAIALRLTRRVLRARATRRTGS